MPESGQCSCGVSLESRLGKAYNAEAFRYFLAIERKRAEASGGAILLVLVSTKKHLGMDRRLPPAVANEVFAAMWLCFREIDFAGWFRQGRIAGAVLTASAEPLTADVARLIEQRLTRALSERVSVDVAVRLQVRIMLLRPAVAH